MRIPFTWEKVQLIIEKKKIAFSSIFLKIQEYIHEITREIQRTQNTYSVVSHCCDSYLLLCTCAFHSVQCTELNIMDKETYSYK